MKTTTAKTNGISSEAVKKATGKDWAQWGRLLDRDGCRSLDHKGIVKVVKTKYGIGPWWQQMVTVGYEQMRGLRKKHQRTEGFAIGVSRTITASAGALFDLWSSASKRARWLPKTRIVVTKATRPKSLRATIATGDTRLMVTFLGKPGGKTTMTVEQMKLGTAQAARKAKAFWSTRLEALQKLVTT